MNEQSYSMPDLTQFQQQYGLTEQQPIDIGGYNVTTCPTTDDCSEGNLDIQYIMGLAQNTITYYWYVDGNDPFVEWITDVANSENPPLVNSISWGSVEVTNSPSSLDTFNNEAIKLANMGVTILVSSGDNGVSSGYCNLDSSSSNSNWGGSNSWTGNGYFPSFPATCPYVTAVGATQGPNVNNGPEVACQGNTGGVITTGGGFSTYYAQPSWQTDAVDNYFNNLTTQPGAGYNRYGRGLPDVAFIGVDFPVIINGVTYSLYGTSASTPLFAAFVSLLNAQRLASNLTAIGFLNPTLYSTGLNTSADAFTDITEGENFCLTSGNPCCQDSGFVTAVGWDPVTGWGSMLYADFTKTFGTVSATYVPTDDDDDGKDDTVTLIIVIVVVLLVLGAAGVGVYMAGASLLSACFGSSNTASSKEAVPLASTTTMQLRAAPAVSVQPYIANPLHPQAYPQQAYPQQAYPQQAYPQQAYPQQTYPQATAPPSM